MENAEPILTIREAQEKLQTNWGWRAAIDPPATCSLLVMKREDGFNRWIISPESEMACVEIHDDGEIVIVAKRGERIETAEIPKENVVVPASPTQEL